MVAAVGSLFTQCHEDATSSSIVEYFCNADFGKLFLFISEVFFLANREYFVIMASEADTLC